VHPRASVFLPVRNLDRKIGGLLLFMGEGVHVHPEDLKRMQMIAEHSAGALERIRAEEMSKQNEERFEYAAKATSDAIWDWDLQTHEIAISDSFAEILGMKLHNVVPEINSWSGRIHPEDAERVSSSLDELFGSERNYWTNEY